MKRRWCVFAGVMVLVLVLLALPLDGAAFAKRQITIAHYMLDVYNKQLDIVIERYQKSHPDVAVKYMTIPSTEYHTWHLTQLAGGDPPDIMQNNWAAEDFRKGLIVSLDEYISKVNPYTGNIWKDMFEPGSLDSFVSRDPVTRKLIGIPVNWSSFAFFYNKDVFKKLGLAPPKTWAEWFQVAEKLKAADYIPQAATFTGGPEVWSVGYIEGTMWQTWVPKLDVLQPNGQVDLNELVRAIQLDLIKVDDPQFRAPYEFLKKWSEYWQAGAVGATDHSRLWMTGKAAFFMAGSWALQSIEENKDRGFDYGIFVFPDITRETSPYATGSTCRPGEAGITWSIPAATVKRGNLDLAIDFLQFMTSPENATVLEKAYNMPPIIKGVEPDNPKVKAFVAPEANPRIQLSLTGPFGDMKFKNLQLLLSGGLTMDKFVQTLGREMKRAAEQLARENNWTSQNNWGAPSK
ncbi:MAG: extracellular solute-binding protein [Bacillota bacterium]|nr:extracellular solute-binding protein [Bacillota bacterium]